MRFLIIVSILVSIAFLSYSIFGVIKNKNAGNQINPKSIKYSEDKSNLQKLIKSKIESVDLKKDFILGSKNAEIFVIEYFDMESDKSAAFFESLRRLEAKWISSKKVAFVFRIFPLKQFEGKYKSAFIEDKAVLCVGENFGIEKMQYLREKIYNQTKFDGEFSKQNIINIVGKIVPNQDTFLNCLNDDKKNKELEEKRENGIKSGIMGTPYTFIELPNKQIFQTPPDFLTIDSSLEAYFIDNGDDRGNK